MTDWLLRLARWIAGPSHAEWADAMAAEANAAGTASARWALGCVGAMLVDRTRREARSIAFILILPLFVHCLQYALFFPTAAISRAYDLPRWAFLSVGIFEALP